MGAVCGIVRRAANGTYLARRSPFRPMRTWTIFPEDMGKRDRRVAASLKHWLFVGNMPPRAAGNRRPLGPFDDPHPWFICAKARNQWFTPLLACSPLLMCTEEFTVILTSVRLALRWAIEFWGYGKQQTCPLWTYYLWKDINEAKWQAQVEEQAHDACKTPVLMMMHR